MSDTDTEPEGCGQWLTAKDNRRLQKPVSQKRNKKNKAAVKILSRAVNGISNSSFDSDVKWNPHTTQTKQKIQRTKQTKMDRFLKSSRSELHAAILDDDIDPVTIKITTKSIPLKRRLQSDTINIGEDDGNAVFNWEFNGTIKRSGFATSPESSKEGSESKENIFHNLRESDKYSGTTAKRCKSLDGRTKNNKTEKKNEMEGRTLLDEASPAFQYTQWAKKQVQECQKLQEVHTSDSLQSLQQSIHNPVTLEENLTVSQEHLPERHMAEKLTSKGKNVLSQQAQQRCAFQSACRQAPHKDYTVKEHILERHGAVNYNQGLETEPNFVERGQTLPTSSAQITKCYTDECSQHLESPFHFSDWVRNQISDCERLQWEQSQQSNNWYDA